jgi:probable LLM family oxidoreductase
MEFGFYTFGDLAGSPSDKISFRNATNQRFKTLIDEIIFADELGMDVFGLGEHHRADYVISNPVTVLAAASVLTKKIKLSTAVTVLSSDDPVRIYQQFATLDQISNGRAEIMVGRGSFIESFPLFGYDLNDYDELFEEKLELLIKLNKQEEGSWRGRFRSPLRSMNIFPKSFQEEIPLWIAAGGTPASAIRAGKLKLPLALAIIGGSPSQFKPFTDLYKKTLSEKGVQKNEIQLSVNTHVYVAENSQKAADEYFHSYAQVMSTIGKERGWSPLTREQFEYSRSEKGSLMVGSPQQVIDKILYEYELFGHTRFLAQMSMGNLTHTHLRKSMELFATKVIPAVKKMIG